MLKIILSVLRSIHQPNDEERWRADPLSHPELARMSETELADLPIGHQWLPQQFANCSR